MKKTIFLTIIFVLFACINCSAKDKTIITGKNMEFIKAGEKIVFSQGAKVEKGSMTVTADKMVQDRTKESIEASGNINFKTYNENGELIEARSDYAVFNSKTGEGELSVGKSLTREGRPKIYYHQKTENTPVFLEADRIKFNKDNKVVESFGNIDIISSSGTVKSQHAIFYQNEKNIVLDGSPQSEVIYTANKRDDWFKADLISVTFSDKKTKMKGNVKGRVKYNSDK